MLSLTTSKGSKGALGFAHLHLSVRRPSSAEPRPRSRLLTPPAHHPSTFPKYMQSLPLLSYFSLLPSLLSHSHTHSQWQLLLLKLSSSVADVSISPAFPHPGHRLLTFAVSGLSAAHTIYQNGGNVLVLDKQGTHRHFLVI